MVITDKSFSPRLLNYVEPYDMGAVVKTLFWTEVNSNLKVGDKVFIIGGYYDSNANIEKNKYKIASDGYEVLYVDRCKVVLDIDFVNELPFEEESDDSFIRIYHVKDRQDFLKVNREITTRGGNFDYKFNQGQNNFIFVDDDSDISLSPINEGWGKNGGISGSGQAGIFVRDGINGWINVTSDFLNNTLPLSTTYTNNEKIKIFNSTFTLQGKEYNENYTYYYNNGWLEDNTNRVKSPVISKSNFRGGDFRGEWNSGVYGLYEDKISWQGAPATWNGGTLINSRWLSGEFNTRTTLSESYSSDLDEDNVPFQKINSPNNNGFGFSYIISSNMDEAIINSGNLYYSEIQPNSSTQSVNTHIKDLDNNFNLLQKASFNFCLINNVQINESEIKNSISSNVKFINSNLINTQNKNVVIKDSSYLIDNKVKVLGFSELNMSEFLTNDSIQPGLTWSLNEDSHKVYKFYIDKDSYHTLRNKDFIYLKDIIISGNNEILNFFDKKLRLSSWTEYYDFYDSTSEDFIKRGFEMGAFLSTPKENEYLFDSVELNGNFYTEATTLNQNSIFYSLDVIVSRTDSNLLPLSLSSLNLNNLSDNINISNAYIEVSDLESGLVETSDWLEGSQINYNNDNNITEIDGSGGFYNMELITGTNSLIINTLHDPNYPEASYNCFCEDDIAFLNSVYYDTRGKIDSFTLSASGSNYTTSNNVELLSGSGENATVDIIADTIGETLILSGSGSSNNYSSGGSVFTNSVNSSGGGLFISFGLTNSSVDINSIVILDGGSGYEIGDIVEIPGGNPAQQLIIDSVTVGEILDISLNDGGIKYQDGEILTINDGDLNASIEILSITGSLDRLPDSYKITNNNLLGEITLEELNTDILSYLLPGGLFYTPDGENRWGYLYKSKFLESKISRGLFKRTYLKDCFVENELYNMEDIDFNNKRRIKSLLITDTLFSDNGNDLSKATYMFSNFTSGNDNLFDGFVYKSTWNKGDFTNGVFKRSTWLNGLFLDGLFYDSRSFNAEADSLYQFYYDDRIKSHYKTGVVSATQSNNRYSWQSGEFKNGEFLNSDWEDGLFDGGKFYSSKWYSGTFSSGKIGDVSIPQSETRFYNGAILGGTVERSTIISSDTSFNGETTQEINWYDGIFNSGVFGVDVSQTATNSTTWHDGIFNDGEIVTTTKWKNGIFNGGNFNSYFGWTMSESVDSDDYSWEEGKFNGGEFGNENGLTNSTWFDGEFYGGKFVGRVWNSGDFYFGEFEGSPTFSCIGGLSSSNANDFVNSYTSSYYGKWRNGKVSDDAIVDKDTLDNKKDSLAVFKNVLWESGEFKHQSGEMHNVVWLDGIFRNGLFKESSFNPFVNRDGVLSFNLDDDTCYWSNGFLDNSDFHISEWRKGTFISGTAWGAIFKNGVVNYMNAYNVFWEDGLWKNGNWYGSDFNYNGEITDEFTTQILNRGAQWLDATTPTYHIWNIFKDDSDTGLIDGASASTASDENFNPPTLSRFNIRNPGSIGGDFGGIIIQQI